MTAPLIVQPGFLFDRAAEWNDDLPLLGPKDIAAGLPDDVLGSVEVLVTVGSTFDPKLIESLPELRLLACFSTGIEAIDTALLERRGIQLTTAAGVNAHDVADQAIALFLAQRHGVIGADAMVREGGWQAGFRQGLAPRRSLRGRNAGVVGLGRIGSEIASRAAAHAMNVRWWGPREKRGAAYGRADSLEQLAKWADALFLACAISPENAGLIDRRILDALGPRGVLVNITRGMLVDEDGLRAALSEGTLGGAGLDVFVEEPTDAALWRDIPNVVLSPHIAGFTQEAGRDMFGQLRENIRRYYAGEPLLTPYFTEAAYSS
ncbi:NAD(P)-dependent oxidoreductase [Croceibacterium aestuarii]|uniref:NAD(P)-dependent oxidoreductase n=1 Tax=Croceibacterium aestuarii TaxID=3064139 RepID=UPI00272E4D09|nr:NAD(P)-dependent oxidoreductase [Croceibacterium sp. D39]